MRALALSPRVLAVTEELFGRPVLPFQTLNFPVGTQQPPHFDSMAFQSDPPGFMCGVWVALEDMDMTNGPLQYYPGSHKLRCADLEGDRGGDGPVSVGGRLRVQARIPGRPVTAVRPVLSAADQEARLRAGVRHDPKGAGIGLVPEPHPRRRGQTDKSKTRNSQVTHYFFEGCRYYGPMYSEPDHIVWEYPTWIREPPPSRSNDEIREAIESTVPQGATVLIAGGDPALMDIADRDTRPFPQQPDADAVRHLRDSDGGAEYLVVPRPLFGWLQWRLTGFRRISSERAARRS